MYQERRYRRYFKGINLVFFNVRIYETDLEIGAEKDLTDVARACVLKYRKQLEDYIREHPLFLTSLVPLEATENAPLIVQNMCMAAARANVGPMAAVAGAISELVGKELLNHSSNVIVENGGDIFIKSTITRKVGIYAGKSPLSNRIAVEILPEMTPMGICTSSGTVGHSLSFGKADAVVGLSRDTALADAAATAACNIVKSAEDIEKGLALLSHIRGIEGGIVIIGEKMGAWGNVKLTEY